MVTSTLRILLDCKCAVNTILDEVKRLYRVVLAIRVSLHRPPVPDPPHYQLLLKPTLILFTALKSPRWIPYLSSKASSKFGLPLQVKGLVLSI